ncbi:adenylate isopentenyltransferase [Pyrus ussuriensis x Pyrus communis]|uniref:adenylate dimethylallyltransferase (ADP/ATP-dependent) n=1 Tax=Pyrus ussuriensis x Pyrus communis TaxID=2448454 RepID=A0A5N5HFE1_9ROSA|nr:adenylate isopentenyltransferase [Pyrus ussuriensis x Pyrus communis]
MRILMSAFKQVVQPMVSFHGPALTNINMDPFFRRKDKVVIVMGATGTGKSRLAIDLAMHYPAEIINSDKMQVYKGLDIVTNKVTEEECKGIPHHLIGKVDPNSNFTANDFKHHASLAIESILERDRLPIIAGGSNSYIEALVDKHSEFRMKYECCFLWVDVAIHVLHSFVSKRVDRMVKVGLVDEVRKMFDSTTEAEYTHGIRQAIGVPEMHEYLHCEASGSNDDETQERLLQAAISKIKENTCILAYRQLQKIRRLQARRGWNMHRLDATEAFLKHQGEADQAWEKFVTAPATRMVDKFLLDPIPSILPTEAVIKPPRFFPRLCRQWLPQHGN